MEIYDHCLAILYLADDQVIIACLEKDIGPILRKVRDKYKTKNNIHTYEEERGKKQNISEIRRRSTTARNKTSQKV